MHNLYLERYAAFPEPLLDQPPARELGMVLVIPAYNEPEILKTLRSIKECISPASAVEVFVIINHAESTSSMIKSYNLMTYEECLKWADENNTPELSFHMVLREFADKHAGVGLARKTGMDEAVRRFEMQNNHDQGIIVNLDADCTVDPNYLVAIEEYFTSQLKSPGASIYYEHPLDGEFAESIYDGIIAYELFLRYYAHGLRYAGFPYYFQTVGSSMAVRSSAYQKQGGMNRRKAGEDFYFIHKIIPLGGYSEIKSTRVIPSPRPSDRVPFGTGKAITGWENQSGLEYMTYHPDTFKSLELLFKSLESVFQNQEIPDDALDEPLGRFLADHSFHLDPILKNATSYPTFLRKFYEWFNGFRVLKFIHYYRDNYKEQIPVDEAAKILLERNTAIQVPSDTRELLMLYRKLDRRS